LGFALFIWKFFRLAENIQDREFFAVFIGFFNCFLRAPPYDSAWKDNLLRGVKR
jgi:hypothetical protein